MLFKVTDDGAVCYSSRKFTQDFFPLSSTFVKILGIWHSEDARRESHTHSATITKKMVSIKPSIDPKIS